MSIRWLCISTYTNANIAQERCVWGVAAKYRNTISKVTKGDSILMYAMQEKRGDVVIPSAIVAECQAVSELYEDQTRTFESPPFASEEKYPLRLKLKPIKVFEPIIEFKPLIPKLVFIKNKKMWTGHIRGAMRIIPEEDYHTIIQQR